MKKINVFLKSFVWPHYNNSWQPYLLRAPALAMAALAMAVLTVGLNLAGQTGQLLGVAENISESELLELTNEQRLAAGLEPLQINDQLSAAAGVKAADMFTQNYWAHYGPNDATPWQFIKDSG